MYERGKFDDYPCGESSWGIARSKASYKVCLALSKLAELCDPRLTARRDLSNIGNTIYHVFDQFLLEPDMTV
jgi:hypothetical protein